MLKKQALKSGETKVTFELDHLPDAEQVELVGEWNEWSATPMTKYKNGKHKATVNLAPGAYHYRYRVDGGEWINDPAADRYAANEYGEHNSVVEC